ncbi:hypothetical protein K435DRAFT_804112 [Dendrothele bispora CBS 962.96]|uniref:Uncharacterized protein n=1 Tax=Dendrothele bispora (strain CBS 962.96) TaxID=1314807 RepID=A0A4V4HDK8_DENBC|nr:hypothetical protein K435DRAFT_804112 [Dendrothele bispora CBS 962.96]
MSTPFGKCTQQIRICKAAVSSGITNSQVGPLGNSRCWNIFRTNGLVSAICLGGPWAASTSSNSEEEPSSIQLGKVQELDTGVREAPRCAANIIVSGTQPHHTHERAEGSLSNVFSWEEEGPQWIQDFHFIKIPQTRTFYYSLCSSQNPGLVSALPRAAMVHFILTSSNDPGRLDREMKNLGSTSTSTHGLARF